MAGHLSDAVGQLSQRNDGIMTFACNGDFGILDGNEWEWEQTWDNTNMRCLRHSAVGDSIGFYGVNMDITKLRWIRLSVVGDSIGFYGATRDSTKSRWIRPSVDGDNTGFFVANRDITKM